MEGSRLHRSEISQFRPLSAIEVAATAQAKVTPGYAPPRMVPVQQLVAAFRSDATKRPKQTSGTRGGKTGGAQSKPTHQSKVEPFTSVCAFIIICSMHLQPIVQHRQQGSLHVYSVPYSEHSSFPELAQLVAALDPIHIVPTVGREDSHSHMVQMLREKASELCVLQKQDTFEVR